jgi:tRNA threonylcarbamoyladenosine modification (KEOPS) complex  Pcc1 subunit
MIAKLEIDCKNPQVVLNSLKPDVEKIGKFEVELKVEKNKLLLTIKSKELTGLLAGINSYVRLIKVSEDVVSI